MTKFVRLLAIPSLCLCLLAQVAHAADAPKYLSPTAVVADKAGATLYIAQLAANQVAVFDVASSSIKRIIPLKDAPWGLALSADGKQLYVTMGQAGGQLAVVDLDKGKVKTSIDVGHSPTSPVVSADGKCVYVCNRFNNNVGIVDLTARKQVATIPVTREPIAAALAGDGKTLVVANLLPAGAADGEYVAARVDLLDVAARKPITSLTLPNGSTSLHGVAISPDGKTAFVTHILARYQLPTTQLERGWMNTNALTVIDLTAGKIVNTLLLDDLDRGAANAWALAVTADAKSLVVTHAGSQELSVIDLPGLTDKLAKAAAPKPAATDAAAAQGAYTDDIAVPNDLTFLVGLRKRIPLAGNGPRSLALVANKAYVANYFTDSLDIVDLAAERDAVKTVAMGPSQPQTSQRRGEMLFHDASLCFQNWQSCSSCHPDARVDALNWDLLNDGIGNPKNSRSMLNVHKRAPVMSLGIRDTAEVAVRSGIKYIQFAVRPEQDAADIDVYLKGLAPIPSPYLVRGKLSDSAKRGKKVFESAGCATCHSGDLFTGLATFDLGLGKGMDSGKKFVTSTLLEIWRTAPYLYDGRAATVEEIFTRFNADNKHGATSKLSKGQLADLVEYVLSL